MKKFFKIAVLLLAMIASISAFAACKKVESISITDANTPRATYVQGQDLDLSSGKLTLNYKDETEEVPFTHEEVTVSNYDKSKLGEQKVLVKYKDFSTTFTVNVVPRMVAENITANYFVGEQFETKGQLKIYKDDGKSFTVALTSDKLTLSGFSSSAANDAQKINAVYKDKTTGEEYNGSFNVKVHAIDKDKSVFKKPNKTEYGSHETKINLAGSYLTLKNATGSYEKFVTITDDMVSGYEPSKATIENRTNPLTQTVSINFADVSYEFKVKVTYSDVTYIKTVIDKVKDYDWTGEEAPEFTVEEQNDSIQAATLYFNLSDEDKAYFTTEEIESIMRPAAYFGFTGWVDTLSEFDKTFAISTRGTIILRCETYDQTLADFAKLMNEEDVHPFMSLGKVLYQIKENFPELVIVSDVTVEDSMIKVVYNPDNIPDIYKLINYICGLYDTMKQVPENWTLDTLKADNNKLGFLIESIVIKIGASDYTTLGDRDAYSVLSNWRPDFFDIIYTYYYDAMTAETNPKPISALNNVKNLQLSGNLEKLYEFILNGIYQIIGMDEDSSKTSVYDATSFIYYLEEGYQLANQIAEGDNELEKFFFKNLKFDDLLKNPVSFTDLLLSLRGLNFGYYDHFGPMVENQKIQNLWYDYLDVWEKAILGGEIQGVEDDYIKSDDFDAKVEKMFADFLALDYSEQVGFMASVNVLNERDHYSLYYESHANEYGDVQIACYNQFAGFIGLSYGRQLSARGRDILQQLVMCIDVYAKRHINGAFQDRFESYMSSLMINYQALDPEERNEFNKLTVGDETLQDILKRYNNYYTKASGTNDYHSTGSYSPAIPSTYNNMFAQLISAIEKANSVYNNIVNSRTPGPNGIPLYPYAEYVKFFSAHEVAVKLQKQILESGNQQAISAYYNTLVSVDGKATTLEFAMYDSSINYYDEITGIAITNGYYVLMDFYFSVGIDEFMLSAYDVAWIDDDTVVNQALKTSVVNAMRTYMNLPANGKTLTASIDKGANNYYRGLEKFFQKALTEKAAAVASKLVVAEKAYTTYLYEGDEIPEGETESALDKFYTAFEDLNNDYNLLNTTDKASFNLLAEIFDFYADKYDELKTPATQA